MLKKKVKMKPPPVFKRGDRVKWPSGTGVVIEVVPKNVPPKSYGYGYSTRKHESYVVEVARVSKRGGDLKPLRYWPFVSRLKHAPARKAK